MKVFFLLLLLALAPLAGAEVVVTMPQAELVKETPSGAELKLAFDTEYKIGLRNTDNSRRALVHVSIDGRAATGTGVILRKGETVELERFIDSGDLKRGPKFKFVEDNSSRPSWSQAGEIRVLVQYEKATEPVVRFQNRPDQWYIYSSRIGELGGTITTDATGQLSYSTNTAGTLTGPVTSVWSAPDSLSPGITVEGSESRQRFEKAELGELEDRADTVILRLAGYHAKPALLMRNR